MTVELIEEFRGIVKPFVANALFNTNYENMGDVDKVEFERDFDEILDLAIKALEDSDARYRIGYDEGYEEGHTKGCEEAEARFEDRPTGKWISVKDRLPPVANKSYLVSVDYRNGLNAVLSLWWHGKGMGWSHGFNDSVIAWQLLPKPYKEIENENGN